MRRLRLLGVLAVVALAAAACGGSSDDGSSTAGTEPGGLVGLVRDDPLMVGDVSLPEVTENPDGVPFAFRAPPGELLIGYFGYTSCPDVCPTTLAYLRSATTALGAGDRVSVAMATVDPDRDTPERLTGYLRSFADDVHALRTTDRAQLQAAEDRFGAQSQVDVTPDGKVEVQHTGTAYVIDDQGRVLVEWPFGVSAEDMQNDLRILLDGSGSSA